jgi:branched-chain amino acid transport system permease protein
LRGSGVSKHSGLFHWIFVIAKQVEEIVVPAKAGIQYILDSREEALTSNSSPARGRGERTEASQGKAGGNDIEKRVINIRDMLDFWITHREFIVISLLNGVSYGLLLFMMSAGLTLIFSMMGVLNFAHASFYMLGAYFAYQTSVWTNFWVGLFIAPLIVALLGAAFERFALRKVYKFGHVPELLITFGLSYVILEVVQVVWGRSAMDYRVPDALNGPLMTVFNTQFPLYRGFMMFIALLMLLALWLVLKRTRIGLVIQAALTHPDMTQALGHNVPRVFMLVFGGGAALAGLAGVIGGNAFVTEPGMAATVGAIIFVVIVVGGMGSLVGAFIASILIGTLQTFAVGLDWSLVGAAKSLGQSITPDTFGYPLWKLKLSQTAPILPYLLLILMLIFRPKGLMGTRDE